MTITRKEIKPLVDEQLATVFLEFFPSSNQYKLFNQYSKTFDNRDSNIINFMAKYRAFTLTLCKGFEIQKLAGIEKINQELLWRTTTYLVLTELIGNDFVDRTLLLLIGKGCEFHLEPDNEHKYTRHAKNLEDLEQSYIPLAVKLDFLKANGLPFFLDWIDHRLRNKIAHLDYAIKDGGFYIKRDGKDKKIDLKEKMSTFTEYYNCIKEFFHEQEKSKQNLKAKNIK